MPYRIHHGRTGQIRHLQSTYEAVVDADHNLVRAVATHVDVTAVVTASEIAESAKSAAAVARTALVRRVSESIATTQFGIDDLLLTIAELAAAALGAGVVLRILGPDQRTVERDVTAHDAEPARLNPERAAGFSATGVDPSGIAGQVIGRKAGLDDRSPQPQSGPAAQVGDMPGRASASSSRPSATTGKFLVCLRYREAHRTRRSNPATRTWCRCSPTGPVPRWRRAGPWRPPPSGARRGRRRR